MSLVNGEENEKELRVEKVIKKKGDKFHGNWKSQDHSFNKKYVIIQNELAFPKPYERSNGYINIKVVLDLPYYATRAYWC